MNRPKLPREWLPAALVVLAFIAGALQSPYFLDGRYLLDASTLYVEAGLMALGMTLVIISGNIDLSVASILALVACLAAMALGTGWNPWMVGLGAAGLGAALGSLNGALVAYLRLPSFVVTLATMAIFRGIAHALLGAESVRVPSFFVGIDMRPFVGPVPTSLVLWLGMAIVFALLLHRTVLGRWWFAVGTNEPAAFFAGVPTARTKLAAFALSGMLAGLAGLHICSRLGVARYDHARGLELDVITAVVLGGTSIQGGRGSILGTCLALALIMLLRTGMGVANVKAEYQLAVIGTLLVLSVAAGNRFRPKG